MRHSVTTGVHRHLMFRRCARALAAAATEGAHRAVASSSSSSSSSASRARAPGARVVGQRTRGKRTDAAAKAKDAAAAEAPAASADAPDNPLGSVMFPWERAVLDSERWVGELKPWQKAYWVAFGLGVAFVVGSRAKRYYDDMGTDEDRIRAMENNKRALAAALEGKSFIAHGDGDEEDETGGDPFEGLSPAEIEALVKKQAGESGDVYDGMSPEEILAHEEAYKGKGKLTWKTSAKF